MDKDYRLFDFQKVIEKVKEKQHDEEIAEDFNKLMDSIKEDSVIEDMPFYQDYLSLFDVERAFDDYKFVAEEETLASRDDLILLFRLIAASLSSTYDILYDKSSNSIDISISVTLGERSLTKSVAELSFFQIERLYVNYIGEQANFYVYHIDPDNSQEIDRERKMKLMIFEKKVRQLCNQKGSNEILSDLDDLLNS